VLKGINVRSTILCRSQFTAPWGFRVDASDLAKFHIVLEGAAWLELDRPAESHRLEAGTIVVLPQGTGHSVCDDPSSSVRDLEKILADHPLITLAGEVAAFARATSASIVSSASSAKRSECQ
jgi:Cupin